MGESVRLVSDVLEMSKQFNFDGFLLTIDIEKAFDSVDHTFLIATLESMNLAPDFIDWIKFFYSSEEIY